MKPNKTETHNKVPIRRSYNATHSGIKHKCRTPRSEAIKIHVEGNFITIFLLIIAAIIFLVCSIFWLLFNAIVRTVILAAGAAFVTFLMKFVYSQFKKRIEHLKIQFNVETIRTIKHFIIILLVIPIIGSYICLYIPSYHAWTSNLSKNILSFFVEELNKDSEATNNNDPTNNTSKYNQNANFIINNDNLSFNIDSNLISAVQLSKTSNCSDIMGLYNNLYGTKKPIKNPEDFSKIQERENAFLEAIISAQTYKSSNDVDEKWYQLLPTENELLHVLDSQVNYSINYPDYLIFFRISNNYQRLALEYYNQDSYPDTIKYYYLMSLYYDIKCMEYAQNDSEFMTSVSRAYFRYNDIFVCCKNTPDENSILLDLMNQLSNVVY